MPFQGFFKNFKKLLPSKRTEHQTKFEIHFTMEKKRLSA